MLAECMAQVGVTERLLERAQKAVANVRGLRGGDRVYTPLVVSAEFGQGNAPLATLIFNVPADADYWAYRLLLYPYCKVIDPAFLTPDEIVYRPTSFSGEPGSTGVKSPATAYSDFNNMLDGTFGLINDGKEVQNIDSPMSAAYCTNLGKWLTQQENSSFGHWGGATQTPGGFVFDVPFFVPRGKTLQIRLTPTYLGVRSITETITVAAAPVVTTRQHMYKIVAVLEGEKKVAAFR